MLYSTLLGKTKKEAPKDETSLNAQLLIRGGFVQKEMAGAYIYMPLGLKVLEKLTQIISEEMEAIEGQEVLMTTLQNPETWKKTGRWDDRVVDVWFKSKLATGADVGLANTHEEPLTELLTKYVQSYKDLPLYIFQFQNKLRNELRAKSGLLRAREFIMKDLYSFNRSEEELNAFYELAKQAYYNIFNRAGIGDSTYITFASGGAFSKFSHEYQTTCETGEDTIYLDREKRIAINKEVYFDDVIEDLGLDKNSLEEVKAIEVGNIFKLKTRFSEPLGLTYTDEDGTEKPVYMGSYGIGLGRLMATIVELCNDEKGIIWPENVAPYRFHILGLNLDDPEVKEKADNVYATLLEGSVEVLYDDRMDVSAGEKFSDADLIGIPYRVVISKKTGNQLEIKKRNEANSEILTIEEFQKLAGS